MYIAQKNILELSGSLEDYRLVLCGWMRWNALRGFTNNVKHCAGE